MLEHCIVKDILKDLPVVFLMTSGKYYIHNLNNIDLQVEANTFLENKK